MYRTTYRSVEISVGPAYLPTLGWTALLAFIQTTLLPLVAFRGSVPSLVTIAVVLYAARVGARRGALLAIPAGLLEDAFGGGIGGATLALTIVALLVGGISRRVFADGAVIAALLCGAAVLLRDLIFWSWLRIGGFPEGFATVHAHAAVVRALLTTLVAFAWLALRGRLVADKTTVHRYP